MAETPGGKGSAEDGRADRGAKVGGVIGAGASSRAAAAAVPAGSGSAAEPAASAAPAVQGNPERIAMHRELMAWAQGFDPLLTFELERDELTAHVSPDRLLHLCRQLRDDATQRFALLVDITAVDYPDRSPRFRVIYHLLSTRFCQRIRLSVAVDEADLVPSVIDIWPAAAWYEREVWDLFGVFFEGNDDLRRIMTDYGFDGHPLRKDFPLTGYQEVRYNEAEGRVVYDKVNLVQDFRSFDFSSPWVGPAGGAGNGGPLPGDEKAG